MEKRIQIGVKLPPSLIGRLDAVRSSMEFPPDRTAVIEKAIEEWIEKSQGATKERTRQKAA